MHDTIAPVPLEKAYRLLNHGPTILVSAHHGGVSNVMTAAWVSVLDFMPPKLTVVLHKTDATRRLVESSGQFGIQVPTVSQVGLVYQLGHRSLANEPDKVERSGARLMSLENCEIPFVAGCSAWLACRLIPEQHTQQAHDLFIGEIVAAWSDTRVFRNGRWRFESADPELRSLHHVCSTHFYAIGEPVEVGEEDVV